MEIYCTIYSIYFTVHFDYKQRDAEYFEAQMQDTKVIDVFYTFNTQETLEASYSCRNV